MLVAADFRERARIALRGNWGVAVGTGFVASLLGAYTAFSSSGGGSGSSSSESSSSYSDMGYENVGSLASGIPDEVLMATVYVLGLIAVVALLFGIVRFIVGGPTTLGYVKFNLDMVNGYRPSFSDLFSQFHRFADGFCMQFLRGLFIFLWSLLLVIPGIVKAHSYAMTPYILYENPGMTASEAISSSKQMMDGNKWRLFCLNFSFIGWAILAALTLGIGFLWLNPYMEASYAAFYEELKREQFVMSSSSDFSQNESFNDGYNMYN